MIDLVAAAKSIQEHGSRRPKKAPPPEAASQSGVIRRSIAQSATQYTPREPRGSRAATANRALCGAEARGDAAALRFPPRDRWRAEIVGSAERHPDRAGTAEPGSDGRRSSARLRRLRGTIPERPLRRRRTWMLWDRGTFRVGGDDPARARCAKGSFISIQAKSCAANGLVRAREDNQWLLPQGRRAPAPAPPWIAPSQRAGRWRRSQRRRRRRPLSSR